jgi:hypothetical protein
MLHVVFFLKKKESFQAQTQWKIHILHLNGAIFGIQYLIFFFMIWWEKINIHGQNIQKTVHLVCFKNILILGRHWIPGVKAFSAGTILDFLFSRFSGCFVFSSKYDILVYVTWFDEKNRGQSERKTFTLFPSRAQNSIFQNVPRAIFTKGIMWINNKKSINSQKCHEVTHL